MKHIAIILTMLFATPTFASLNAIEQKLQSSPAMTKKCDIKIAKLQHIVNRYELIPANRRSGLVKLKLGHFKAELENWKGYCADPDNAVTQGGN